MEDNLNNSRPLDVHVWSDYPEINHLVDALWETYFELIEVIRRGPKSKATKKSHLKVLLLDLYVCWVNDPTMYLAVHMSKSGWKANSRYNALHLSSQMIEVVHKLVDLEYLEFHKGYEGRSSRIRATDQLHFLFHSITVPIPAISFHHTQEVLELRGDADPEISTSKPKLEYTDTDATAEMRAVLRAYNDLLRRSHLDICSLEQPFIDRSITKGPRQGEQVRIHIDHRNIFVKRVFNGGYLLLFVGHSCRISFCCRATGNGVIATKKSECGVDDSKIAALWWLLIEIRHLGGNPFCLVVPSILLPSAKCRW